MSMKSDDTLDFLKDNKFKIYSTSLGSKNSIEKIKFSNSSAIVLGSENSGISTSEISKTSAFPKF